MNPIEAAVREYFRARQHDGVVAAYLFGSHARGKAHPESDVDVGVLFEFAPVPDRHERGRRARSRAHRGYPQCRSLPAVWCSGD